MLELQEVNDKPIWEDFVQNSSIPTSFFQSWNWGDFQQQMHNQVLRLGLFQDGKLVGTALGIVIQAKRGKYLYVRNGPVLNWENPEQVETMIQGLQTYARKAGLWFVRISPHVTSESPAGEWIAAKKYPVSPMYDVDALDTWILDLTQPEEEILQNMRKSVRYEIRKAEKDGVEIIKSQNTSDLDAFYEIYQDTIKRQKWMGYTKEYIKTQFETFVKDNQAQLFLAKYQDKYIAASIFIYYGDSSFYHYSGSLSEFAKVPGTSLIHWQNILEAKSRGLKRYNFWGITPENKPDHPWQGLSFYKMGFGGFAERWLPTRDIPLTPLYWLTHVFEQVEKRRRGY